MSEQPKPYNSEQAEGERISEIEGAIREYFGDHNDRVRLRFGDNHNLAEQIFEAETHLKEDGCENGDGAAKTTREQFITCADKKLKDSDLSDSFIYADLNWDKFKGFLNLKKEKFENSEEISCCGLGFKPIIPLLEKGVSPKFKAMVEGVINGSFFMHHAGSWGQGKELNFGEHISLIEKGQFSNRRGFYVTATSRSWGEHHKKNKTCLYFNDLLTKIITPSVEFAHKRIFPIEKGKNFLGQSYLNGDKDFFFLSSRIAGGYDSHRLYDTTDEEAGDVEFILALLAGKSHKLTYFSDILGLVLKPGVGSISTWSEGEYPNAKSYFSLDLKGEDYLLAKLLSDDRDSRIEGTKIIVHREEGDQVSERSKYISCPIMRMTPEILGGVIEYGQNNEVLKVAVPEGREFKIYDHDSFK